VGRGGVVPTCEFRSARPS